MKHRDDLQFLLLLTDDALSAASSPLAWKRAAKDLDDGMSGTIVEDGDQCTVDWEDATCTFLPGGLAASTCTCPARKLCRHRVRSVLWVRHAHKVTEMAEAAEVEDGATTSRPTQAPGTTGGQEPGTAEPGTAEPGTVELETVEPGIAAPETVAPETAEPETAEPGTAEPGAVEPETVDLGAAIEPETVGPAWTAASFGDDELKRAGGLPLWRKAVRAWAEGIACEFPENTHAHFPVLGISVRYLPGYEVGFSVCSCGAQGMCVHRILGALAARPGGLQEQPDGDSRLEPLRRRLWLHLVDLMVVGLDGLPIEAVENLEVLSQESAGILPGPARDLASLARLLRDYHARSARFSGDTWLRTTGRLGCRLDGLRLAQAMEKSVVLRGKGRRSHLNARAMSLFGLGSEGFQSRTGQVVRSWFAQEETGDVFFANVGWGAAQASRSLDSLWSGQPLWGDLTPSEVAHQPLRLVEPRLSPDGALATSGQTRAQIRANTDATWSLLSRSFVVSDEDGLKRRWQGQLPVVLRESSERWLPAVVALEQEALSVCQAHFAAASQTLRVAVPLLDGGSLALTVAHSPGAMTCLRSVERIAEWKPQPTHLFVRYWPTPSGFAAIPISTWLEGELTPRSLGFGAVPDYPKRSPSPVQQRSGHHPQAKEDALLQILRGLQDALEMFAVEGIAHVAEWRLGVLASLGQGLQQMGLTQAAQIIDMLVHTLAHGLLTDDVIRTRIVRLLLSTLAWCLELNERWLLR